MTPVNTTLFPNLYFSHSRTLDYLSRPQRHVYQQTPNEGVKQRFASNVQTPVFVSVNINKEMLDSTLLPLRIRIFLNFLNILY